jgi:hypothetical protein
MEEEIKTKVLDSEVKDSEVYALNFLINTILDYYCEVSSEDEPSEAWKKGTDLENKNKVPDDLDNVIKQAFKSQLKKFIK